MRRKVDDLVQVRRDDLIGQFGADLGGRVFGILKTVSARPIADEGNRTLGRSNEPDFAQLVDEYARSNPSLTRSKIYDRVLQTSEGKAAYNRDKIAQLKKSAELIGDTYGLTS